MHTFVGEDFVYHLKIKNSKRLTGYRETGRERKEAK
jgi:hypothetical protein